MNPQSWEIEDPDTKEVYEIEWDGEGEPSDDVIWGAIEEYRTMNGGGTPKPPPGLTPHIPKPPQKSVSGFIGNFANDAANEIGGAIAGLKALPGLAMSAGQALYDDPKKAIGQVPGMVGNMLTGVKDHAMKYVNDPVGQLYNHPAQALTDVASLTGVGGVAAGASKMGKTAKALNAVSKYTDIPGQAVAAVPRVAGAVGRTVGRKSMNVIRKVGAEGRNKEFVGNLVNPKKFDEAALNASGEAVQNDVLAKKANTFVKLEQEFDQHLGPKGGTQTLDAIPTPPNLNPDPPNLHRGRSAEMRTLMKDAPVESARRVQGPQYAGRAITVSTDTPLAKARPQITKNKRKLEVDAKTINKHSGEFDRITGEVSAPEFGPSFRELHEARGTDLADSPSVTTIRKLQESAATRMGLTKEFEAYLDTTQKWGKAKEQFENRFVSSLLDKPDEAIAGLFKNHQKTYKKKYTTGPDGKPMNTGSVYAGKGAKPFNNKELVGQLKELVEPKTFEKLKAKVGDDLIRKSSGADGLLDPEKLSAMLKKMDDTGLTDEFIPNHKDLRDIADILAREVKTGYFTMPGSKGMIRDAIHTALNKNRMAQPDLQRALRQLRKERHPWAQKIVNIIERGGLASAEAQHFSTDENEVPEPPTRGGQISITGLEP